VGGHHLKVDHAVDDATDLVDEVAERPLLLGDQRRIAGDTVQDPHGGGLAELLHVRGIEKELHDRPPRALRSTSPTGSRRTAAPARTRRKTVASPSIRPNTLTGLAGRISAPRLAGVGPKKTQNAWPGGQNARSPMATTSVAPSASARTGMPK